MSVSMLASNNAPPSIHDLQPVEFGGEIGRGGFTYQDYVAVQFLLQMLLGTEIMEVWCETQDDITLILAPNAGNNHYEVEFIQVKSNELNQLWTVAELCKPDSKAVDKKGTSILEKSLAYDRCAEKCRFRVVTLRDVNAELRLLCLPLSSPKRLNSIDADFLKLRAAIKGKNVKDFRSPNKNSCDFWVQHALWQVSGEQSAIHKANLVDLMQVISAKGHEIFPDQLDEIHSRLLQLAKDAAEFKWVQDPSKKKVKKSFLNSWVDEVIQKTLVLTGSSRGSKLAEKLHNANLDDYLEGALESRRYYLSQRRNPQYLQLAEREEVISEIAAVLHHLKSELDAEEEDPSGVKFHSRCLQELKKLKEQNVAWSNHSLNFFQGCMYDITNRCVHRFTRPKA